MKWQIKTKRSNTNDPVVIPDSTERLITIRANSWYKLGQELVRKYTYPKIKSMLQRCSIQYNDDELQTAWRDFAIASRNGCKLYTPRTFAFFDGATSGYMIRATSGQKKSSDLDLSIWKVITIYELDLYERICIVICNHCKIPLEGCTFVYYCPEKKCKFSLCDSCGSKMKNATYSNWMPCGSKSCNGSLKRVNRKAKNAPHGCTGLSVATDKTDKRALNGQTADLEKGLYNFGVDDSIYRLELTDDEDKVVSTFLFYDAGSCLFPCGLSSVGISMCVYNLLHRDSFSEYIQAIKNQNGDLVLSQLPMSSILWETLFSTVELSSLNQVVEFYRKLSINTSRFTSGAMQMSQPNCGIACFEWSEKRVWCKIYDGGEFAPIIRANHCIKDNNLLTVDEMKINWFQTHERFEAVEKQFTMSYYKNCKCLTREDFIKILSNRGVQNESTIATIVFENGSDLYVRFLCGKSLDITLHRNEWHKYSL